jgi:energy-coupling factor transporter ATP-binding protein EcfA2
VLIAGSSGSGKSTVATALTERMVERSFQFCIFDPEGDYEGLEHAVSVGDARTPPKQAEVLQLLKDLGTNAVVNMQGLALADRPPFFAKLLGEVLDARARLGHPHWLIIDEAHHLVPSARDDGNLLLNEAMNDAILVTVHPEAVSLKALQSVSVVAAVGKRAMDTLASFSEAVGERPAGLAEPPVNEDEVLVWNRGLGEPMRKIRTERPHQARTRHTQKYAEGDLGQDNSFYFRGPNAALNLRAQNLMMFLQIGEGVDDATWEHHLRRREYSSWFRDIIKDNELATEVDEVEADRSLNPGESRRRIAEAVRRRYTAPADAAKG